MAKKFFLGSVGKAEAFRRNANNELELAFVSKTLTDSGLNITTTKDDIRAGTGAPVQFSFYHDSNVEITLTDVLWDREYLQAQLGATFTPYSKDYVTKNVQFTNGIAESFTETINKMPFPCGEEYMVWAAKKGTDDWKEAVYENSTLKLKGSTDSGEYCVRYLGNVTNAHAAEITSMIIPEELFLIITAPIFAGDACSASKGKPAGHITFEVPRFQLNGSQEFAMNMSSNQTMSLSGIALATASDECDSVGGKLLRIIEVFDEGSWLDEIEAITVDSQSAEVGDIPSVYGIFKDGRLKNIENTLLTFDPVLVDGKFTEARDYTVTLTGTSISTEVTVTND